MLLSTYVAEAPWAKFLDSQPGSSIFQSPELNRVYAKTVGFRPFVLAAESQEAISAMVSGAIVSYSNGRLARLTSRAIVVGGPLGEKSSFPAILEALDRLAGRSALCTQIRNLRAPSDRSVFDSRGYRWEDHMNFIVDLDRTKESLWHNLSKARRKAIERADRIGLKLIDLRTEQVRRVYNLLHETYSRARIPLADCSLFENAMEMLGPSGQLWAVAASRGETVCAARFVLRWKRTLFDWYAGSSELGRTSHADEWLVWQILLRGVRQGCVEFDFGGAGPPGTSYGPGEFKRRFGGTSINPGRFQKVYRPLTMRLSKVAFEAWRRWK